MLETYLKEGNVLCYGVPQNEAPDFLQTKKRGRARVFVKGKEYTSLAEIREERGDIYFLDHEALKVLFIDFPGTAQYVLVRLMPRLSWWVALPGLMRRLLIGLVKIEGIKKLSTGGRTQRWLVLRHMLAESLNTRLCLSTEIGIPRFFDHLKKESAQYVILRFFEKLPELHREGGDLDVLVADEDDHKVRAFLQAHPGKIGVDVWTVSRSIHNNITYYPPPLAREIIASAIEGPAGSLVPAPREYFLSFAYHAVYHKGYFAGVPSSMPEAKVNPHPENDYAGTLSRMAKQFGIAVDITMEALDEYLHREGWRPKIDTLAKIAVRNKWVWDRFFSTKPVREIGLGVIIIKQKAFDGGIVDQIMKTIIDQGKFKVVRFKKLNEKEIEYATEHLRGGVWNDASGKVKDFLPAAAVVVLDTHLARLSKLNVKYRYTGGITQLKKILRKKFDTARVSLMHSSDNTHESWEYIRWCFPDEEKEVRDDVERMFNEIHPSWLEHVRFRVVFVPRRLIYRFTLLKQRMSVRIIRWIMEI